MSEIGVFLSHASADKMFARRLGNDLRHYGIDVWIDEAEIKVGDSLIEKISQGLSDMQYVLVLLSEASCNSEWVKKEINIALNQEIYGKKVVILPCLIEDCEIPLFLLDKKYADFRRQSNYVRARTEVVDALGLKEKSATSLFLDQHIFYDLHDLNDGFDVEAIRYFSKSDFEKVINRVEFFGISIFGMEPWPNKQFGGVEVHEMTDYPADDSRWYRTAFKNFISSGIDDYFSASYGVPDELLSMFSKEKTSGTEA
ncbi:toll/interleukin-1 receptor domain-containing protein [Vibrio parahaemolyticus]